MFATTAPVRAPGARPSWPIQRLPIIGGLAACVALAWALAAGPSASAVPVNALSGLSGLAFAIALLRRAVQVVRAGDVLIVVVGALALALVGVLWAATVTFGGEKLALAVWLWLIGLLLCMSRVSRLRSRDHRPRTPWQVIGEARAGPQVRGPLIDLSGLLLGAILLVLGTSLGFDWVTAWLYGLVGGPWPAQLMAATFPLLGASLFLTPFVFLWFMARRGGRHLAPASSSPSHATSPTARHDAEVAAHLHDSVLQTLALIGRTADDPDRVRQLARQQERSLRAWLAGRDEAAATSLTGAIRVAAQEVEDEVTGSRIEVVAVGDAPLDRISDAMVRAAREAMRNAVRHAGSPVRVFVEVEGAAREVFIRDTGAGFDLATITEERRGVRDAIIGRMEHVGGTATIDSGPSGTEIALRAVSPTA
jgi:hypothetical protein